MAQVVLEPLGTVASASVNLYERDRLARIHALVACVWFVGLLSSPLIEAIAFGVLAPVGVVRWRAFWVLRHDRWLATGLLTYVLSIAWAAVSIAWAPEGASADLNLRLATAPLLVIHAGVRTPELRATCLLGGGYRVAVAALMLVGTEFPAALIPHHSSQETPGVLVFGVAVFSTLAGVGWWRQPVMLPAAVLWAMAIAQVRSRATLIAVLSGALISLCTAKQPRGRRATALAALAVAVLSLAWVLRESPLAVKIQSYVAIASREADAAGQLTAPSAIDALLSRRLTIWDWTVRRLGDRWCFGHGAGSWQYDFKADVIANKSMSAWESSKGRITPQAHAHNLGLQIIYEFGLVGFVLVLANLASWSACVWRAANPTTRAFGLAFLGSMLISRMSGQGDLLGRASTLFFAGAACLAACGCTKEAPARQSTASANDPARGKHIQA